MTREMLPGNLKVMYDCASWSDEPDNMLATVEEHGTCEVPVVLITLFRSSSNSCYWLVCMGNRLRYVWEGYLHDAR